LKPKRLLGRLLRGELRNVAFADFRRLVETFGFREHRRSGSHAVYLHPEVHENLSLQPHRSEAKPYQIRQFLSLVEEYNLTVEPEDE